VEVQTFHSNYILYDTDGNNECRGMWKISCVKNQAQEKQRFFAKNN